MFFFNIAHCALSALKIAPVIEMCGKGAHASNALHPVCFTEHIITSIKVAKLRENKRLSQSQLAARLGITKSMVSAYENSARMPSYAVLLRIAGMFNVSLDYLLGTENQIIFRTDGLSESQIAIIMDIIEEFKK